MPFLRPCGPSCALVGFPCFPLLLKLGSPNITRSSPSCFLILLHPPAFLSSFHADIEIAFQLKCRMLPQQEVYQCPNILMMVDYKFRPKERHSSLIHCLFNVSHTSPSLAIMCYLLFACRHLRLSHSGCLLSTKAEPLRVAHNFLFEHKGILDNSRGGKQPKISIIHLAITFSIATELAVFSFALIHPISLLEYSRDVTDDQSEH